MIGNGFVKLINCMGDDLMVVNAARVSFNKTSSYDLVSVEDNGIIYQDNRLKEKDAKLINYLAKHDHWTPFAHPHICFHIKAPFPIRTQFFKHKIGFVENEVSRRYVDDPPEFFYPAWSYRPDGSLKQGAGDRMSDEDNNKAHYAYAHALDTCYDAYERLLEIGVAPEQARMVLPMCTFTEWYWTGSLAAYARFYNQRSSPHAQAEIREYAEEIGRICNELFPVSWPALVNSPEESV